MVQGFEPFEFLDRGAVVAFGLGVAEQETVTRGSLRKIEHGEPQESELGGAK